MLRKQFTAPAPQEHARLPRTDVRFSMSQLTVNTNVTSPRPAEFSPIVMECKGHGHVDRRGVRHNSSPVVLETSQQPTTSQLTANNTAEQPNQVARVTFNEATDDTQLVRRSINYLLSQYTSKRRPTHEMIHKVNNQVQEHQHRIDWHDEQISAVQQQLEQLKPTLMHIVALAKKQGNYYLLCEALRDLGCNQALTFLNTYVGLIQSLDMVGQLVATKKFKYNYGQFGLFSDIFVFVAGLVPAPGVQVAATALKLAGESYLDRNNQAFNKKLIETIGGFDDSLKFATDIASMILQLNGKFMSVMTQAEVIRYAEIAKKCTMKYIKNYSDKSEIFAEDIGFSILSGEFKNQVCMEAALQFRLIAFEKGVLKTDRLQPGTNKPVEWLSDRIRDYCKTDLATKAVNRMTLEFF